MFNNKSGKIENFIFFIILTFIYFTVLHDPLSLFPSKSSVSSEGITYGNMIHRSCMVKIEIDSNDIISVRGIDEYGYGRVIDDTQGLKGTIFFTSMVANDHLEIISKEKGSLTHFFENDCSLDTSNLYHLDSSRNPILFLPNPLTDNPVYFNGATIIVGDLDNTQKLTQFQI